MAQLLSRKIQKLKINHEEIGEMNRRDSTTTAGQSNGNVRPKYCCMSIEKCICDCISSKFHIFCIRYYPLAFDEIGARNGEKKNFDDNEHIANAFDVNFQRIPK